MYIYIYIKYIFVLYSKQASKQASNQTTNTIKSIRFINYTEHMELIRMHNRDFIVQCVYVRVCLSLSLSLTISVSILSVPLCLSVSLCLLTRWQYYRFFLDFSFLNVFLSNKLKLSLECSIKTSDIFHCLLQKDDGTFSFWNSRKKEVRNCPSLDTSTCLFRSHAPNRWQFQRINFIITTCFVKRRRFVIHFRSFCVSWEFSCRLFRVKKRKFDVHTMLAKKRAIYLFVFWLVSLYQFASNLIWFVSTLCIHQYLNTSDPDWFWDFASIWNCFIFDTHTYTLHFLPSNIPFLFRWKKIILAHTHTYTFAEPL